MKDRRITTCLISPKKQIHFFCPVTHFESCHLSFLNIMANNLACGSVKGTCTQSDPTRNVIYFTHNSISPTPKRDLYSPLPRPYPILLYWPCSHTKPSEANMIPPPFQFEIFWGRVTNKRRNVRSTSPIPALQNIMDVMVKPRQSGGLI